VIRVLVADDEALIRDSLKMIIDLQNDMSVVGTAGDGEQAAMMARELNPDVVLLDIRMPGTDGLAVVHDISSLAAHPRVAILTTFALDEYVDEAMRGGAAGFLLKDTPPGELIEAIRVIAHGSTVLSQAVSDRAVAARRGPGPEPVDADRAKALAGLTDRERQVLALLARGCSNQVIASTLRMSEGTVKGHVSRTMAKLGAANRVQAALIANGAGEGDTPGAPPTP
jgi:DNA-binding NarL/FixJ family response regulator